MALFFFFFWIVDSYEPTYVQVCVSVGVRIIKKFSYSSYLL